MTMITCLILWIPGGTTYVPDGPPATRGGPAGGSPAGTSAAYATAIKPAARTLATRARMRLAPIVSLSRNAGNQESGTERAYRHQIRPRRKTIGNLGRSAGCLAARARARGWCLSAVDDRQILFAECFLFLAIEDGGPEELLGDQGRHERGEDDDGHELGVLGLADEVVGEPEQRGDGAEGEPGGHQQRGVRTLPPGQPERGRDRPDADQLGAELDQQQDRDHPRAGDQRTGRDERAAARRKKKGVSRAKAMERSRSISTRSCRKTPATTSPAT